MPARRQVGRRGDLPQGHRGAAAAHHRLRTAAGEGRQEDLGAVRARAGADRLGGEHRERGQDLRELRRGRRTHRRAGIPPARAPEVA